MSQETNTDTNDALDAGWDGADVEPGKPGENTVRVELAGAQPVVDALDEARSQIESMTEDLHSALKLLRRWRLNGGQDHSLPRDTVALLERLGALE